MAETRRGHFRVVDYRRASAWCSNERGALCSRGLSRHLGGYRSNRRLCVQNRHLQHLDQTGNPARMDMAPPSYISFVSGAILWDRGVYHCTDSSPPDEPPTLCHRFLNHMNTSPGNVRTPRFLSNSRPTPTHLGQTQRRQAQSVFKNRRCAGPRRGFQSCTSKSLQRDTSKPCMPSSPAPSRTSPDFPASQSPSSHTTRAGQRATTPMPTQPPVLSPLSPPAPPPMQLMAPHERDRDGRDGSSPASLTASSSPAWDQRPGSEFKEVVTPVTPVSLDLDLSDFSRPPSSQFSRSSALSSRRSSVLYGMSEVDSDRNTLSQLRSSSLWLSALASSCSTLDSLPDQPMDPHEGLNRSTLMLGTGNHSDWQRFSPSWSGQDNLASDPRGRPARPGLTPPSIGERRQGHMLRHWTVLPPICPLRGASEAGEPSSFQVSSTESDVFDDLDAVVHRTGSCVPQEHPTDSRSDCSSPDTVLSQRAASLVLGCDSGDLEYLSRVRLLLQDHPGAVEPSAPFPGWGSSSAHSTGHQNEGGGGTNRMLRGDWPTGCGEDTGLRSCVSTGADEQRIHTVASEDRACPGSSRLQESFLSDSAPVAGGSGSSSCQSIGYSRALEAPEAEDPHLKPGCQGSRERVEVRGQRRRPCKLEYLLQERKRKDDERKKAKVLHIYSKLQERGTAQSSPNGHKSHCRFEDFDFLAKYCIFSQEKLTLYKRAFEAVDSDGDGYLSCFQVLLALKEIVPPEVLTESEEVYVYRILEAVDFQVAEGLTDLRLFAVVASLAQKIASLDDFVRSLIGKMEFRSMETKLYRAKQLFLFLLETQAEASPAQDGLLSAEQLLVELRAGGIRPEHEEVVKSQLQRIHSLDLLDFLAHLPLFLLIHSTVIANPLDDTRSL